MSLSVAWVLLALPGNGGSGDPLAGQWTLNVGRSHYGGGAERRARETFTCRPHGAALRCTIESVWADGRRLVGSFTARYDGKPHPAAGIPDVDRVTLHRRSALVADATFTLEGKPVFGYRAVRSSDGRSLTIVSVEPTTRVVGESIIVYDRRAPP